MRRDFLKNLGFNTAAAAFAANHNTSKTPLMSNKETVKVFNEYRKTAIVKAKIFEPGDEDGFAPPMGLGDLLDDVRNGIDPQTSLKPYVSALENKMLFGAFGKHYLCIGIEGERWLVEKIIFEKTYELVD